MGYDIYLKWKGQTSEESDKQITGYSITAGHVGYLRASYGWADMIRVFEILFKGQWESHENILTASEIAKNLKLAKRLPEWKKIKKEDGARVMQSVEDFVKLAVQKEKETGWIEVRIS